MGRRGAESELLRRSERRSLVAGGHGRRDRGWWRLGRGGAERRTNGVVAPVPSSRAAGFFIFLRSGPRAVVSVAAGERRTRLECCEIPSRFLAAPRAPLVCPVLRGPRVSGRMGRGERCGETCGAARRWTGVRGERETCTLGGGGCLSLLARRSKAWSTTGRQGEMLLLRE
jgi:hypothetical protein